MIGYWLWLWHKGGSSGGDSFCKGGSYNSLRRSIVSACMWGRGEYSYEIYEIIS